MTTILMSALVALTVGAQAVKSEELYKKNEVGLTLGATHSLNDPDSKWGSDLGVRAFPLNKYLGFDATAGFNKVDSGPVVDNTRFNGILRLPLDKYRVSLEAVGGAVYQFSEDDYQWAVGPRLTYRINPHVELFGGFRYNFARQNLPIKREIPFGINVNF